jgi:hypothetical protein
MIVLLRIFFVIVFASMLWVTSWASLHEALGDFARGPVIRNPWVIATLFDAYWAFLAFYVWVAWKEQSWVARVLWFFVMLALGNLAIALYMLVELSRVSASAPADAELTKVFTRRNPGALLFPGTLTGISVVVYLLA